MTDFAVLRTVYKNDEHYVVIPEAGVQETISDGVLVLADATARTIDRSVGSSDYMPNDRAVPAGQERHIARKSFDGCGKGCEAVKLSQGEVYEARYRQDGGSKLDLSSKVVWQAR